MHSPTLPIEKGVDKREYHVALVCVCVAFEAPRAVWRRFVWCSPAAGVCVQRTADFEWGGR